jgi:hypothetical protein
VNRELPVVDPLRADEVGPQVGEVEGVIGAAATELFEFRVAPPVGGDVDSDEAGSETLAGERRPVRRPHPAGK